MALLWRSCQRTNLVTAAGVALAAALAVLSALALLSPEAGAAPSIMQGRVVAPGANWTGGTILVEGNLTVEPGAVLRIEGATVLLAGTARIESGGHVVLGPHDGKPASLQPMNAQGYALVVDGELRSGGLPKTQVAGLGGQPLPAAISGQPAGILVRGGAELREVDIENGTAGVIVLPGGRLVMEDASVERVGIFGIIVEGAAELRRVTTAAVDNALVGRGNTTVVRVWDSSLHGRVASLHNIGALVVVENSDLRGSNNVVIEGRAPRLFINGSVIVGYRVNGLLTKGDGHVEIRDTMFQGAPSEHGHRATGGNDVIRLWNTTFQNHTRAALMGQITEYELHGVHIESSGQGIQMVNGRFAGGLGGVTFGKGEAANLLGDLSFVRVVDALFIDAVTGAQLPGGLLVISDADGRELARGNGTRVTVQFEAYAVDDAGEHAPLSGLRYSMSHAGLAKPKVGELDPEQSLLVAHVDWRAATADRSVWPGVTGGIMAGAGLLLILYAAFYRWMPWHPRIRRGERKQEESAGHVRGEPRNDQDMDYAQ